MQKTLIYALEAAGILTAIYAGLVALFYKALGDPSAKLPLYDTPDLPHTRQHPIPSPFGHRTKAMDVVKGVDLRGKIVVITGGHSGTGREAVRALSTAGATLIVLARDVDRAKRGLRGIANTTVECVDLLQPASIDAFAARYVQSGRPLHILINNAAIMATPLERDDRGYERQFATNVLGHYQLTVRLLPALERAQGARVINVASRGHHAGGVLLDDVNFNHTPYTGMRAYAQTKTALILLSIKEDALWRDRDVRVFATTPGPVPSSDLFAAGSVGRRPRRQVALGRLVAGIVRVLHITEALNLWRRPKNEGDLYKTVEQGGATATWAAVSGDLDGKGGVYVENCDIAPLVPDEGRAPYGVKSWALDAHVADRLWSLCQKMAGVRLR
ncbi:MAG: SDR family NAD(P)-dependent oxidoreductase [Alphaproteobacteria bacterium]|nr:SDR family NAD(P)-dependent oxidoreductase [Alphaproteobacteria bacterium]MBU1516563.1 SDR family NAD(P)-dependent oxidoreductase [Alphaproteobacteria bacterium]MBU2094320.1 SDR family NAD(P)-dependent oxidoreductase [Alphaproteobacteria bacterium]MBU2154103.1 SDR family NAD(P)-dependent oxidoreductase [Alphaproteobacteria bacterium]MBU2307490.1 SDR family NAD(P)-dependent oxidoreductase [Alphaproteobacteria bacterium]